jgi:hypothetical protein
MTALPITGIPVVDAELERREFTNADEAEAMAAKLLAVWHMLRSGSEEDTAVVRRQRRR